MLCSVPTSTSSSRITARDSSDSRAWGPIGVDAIVGRTWLVYWPLSAWKIAPNHAETVPGPSPASP